MAYRQAYPKDQRVYGQREILLTRRLEGHEVIYQLPPKGHMNSKSSPSLRNLEEGVDQTFHLSLTS